MSFKSKYFKWFNCFLFRFGLYIYVLELTHLNRRRHELVLRCWSLLCLLRFCNSCLWLCLFLRHSTRQQDICGFFILRSPCAIGCISHKLRRLRCITAPVSPWGATAWFFIFLDLLLNYYINWRLLRLCHHHIHFFYGLSVFGFWCFGFSW